MMPGQPMPGRMMPTVAASIHPPGGGPTPPGMPPIPGNILGPRVPLTAPNGMCKYPGGGRHYPRDFWGELYTREASTVCSLWGVTDPWTGWPVRGASKSWALVIALQHRWWTGTHVASTECSQLVWSLP